MNRFLRWLADKLIARAQRTPYAHLEGYMNRWWLVPYNRFGIAARVHQILRSDYDRHPHDHPWWYVTIILRGGYWEFTLDSRREKWLRPRWHGPGSILFRRASHFHSLELGLYGWDCDHPPCWTLFITGPKRKDHDPAHSCWGFLVDGVKVPSDQYLGEKYIATDYTRGGSR